MSALAGTASSGLALRLSTSAGCVSAVADAAAAGPMADADADDSSHLPLALALVLVLVHVLVHVEDLCTEPFFVEDVNVHFSKHRFCVDMLIVFSIVDFPPFGFVLKPVWSIHMFLTEL